MNSMLVQIPEIGTARRAALPGIRSAGKTGTTQSYRDAWYVGFTGNYTAAVWLGNDDFTPDQQHDRRLAAGHDLAAADGLCAPEHRPEADPRHRQSRSSTRRSPPRPAKKAAEEAAATPSGRRSCPARRRAPCASITDAFRNAPPIDAPPEPETLSAL